MAECWPKLRDSRRPVSHARVAASSWMRPQAPSGLGYALENRLIVSRLFPEAFRQLRVQHLASSYRQLLATLTRLSR